MRSKCILIFLTLILTANAHGQELSLEKDFGWLVGTWRSEFEIDREFDGVEVKSGQLVQSEETYSWTLDRKFMLLKRVLFSDGRQIATATDLIGHDPSSGKIKQWGFYSTGGNGSGVWSRIDEASLALTWSTVDAQNKKDSGKSILTRVDDDTIEETTVERVIDGKEMPNTPSSTSRRDGTATAESFQQLGELLVGGGGRTLRSSLTGQVRRRHGVKK